MTTNSHLEVFEAVTENQLALEYVQRLVLAIRTLQGGGFSDKTSVGKELLREHHYNKFA